ncbi:Protein of unknown function [Cupriavidus sp. OV038]|jgi:hypothetical protein|uniref:DUF2612 domain-containing protein n=1 Tax=unclassified Cupriavidus TaxID=2640874 RepID=UPI0008DFA52C|nr:MULTISPECIES: DUF2612 domain-containing protein [unclassified Cupriavidus]SFB68398.1 Protein of unknown function [Cupriavidus sp. OV038]SFO57633.1 Protein of unknown function [Cupriavidus sp. OV096]
MDLNQAHGDIAWSNWLSQFKDGGDLEVLVKALLRPADGLQDALRDLHGKRSLETAEGQQLDGIGTIVVLARPDNSLPGNLAHARHADASGELGGVADAPDDLYRRLLRWKIAINNGHGTTPEISDSLEAVFGATRVIVADIGNAKIRIWMDVLPDAFPGVDVAAYVPKLAGVGIKSISGGGAKPFGFVNQGLYGFGVGTFSRSF